MFFSRPIPLSFSIVAPKRENKDNVALNVQNRKIADFPSFVRFQSTRKSLRAPCSYMYFTSCLRIFSKHPSLTLAAHRV